jgi:T5SS/PEP-CTERM-associated repeat protein
VVGNDGVGNTLTITNSGRVVNADGYIGGASSNNTALVTDGGSVWNNTGNLTVGNNGPGNRLTVTNGGVVTVAGTTFVGYNSSASNNTMLVTGSGSVWSNSGTLYFGYQGAGNQLTLADSGSVVVAGNAYVGYNAGSTNNQIAVAGGNLTVTNAGATGTLNVNYGALTMNGGTVTVNQLLANGGNSVVQFSGGTLNTMATTVANGSPFTVGDGTNAATLNLQGGTHNFANGLVISAAAQVCGAATINGNVTNNGALGSGASVSTLTIASNYTQNAGSALNIKLGGIAANDVLAVSGTAQLGGTLTVMNLNGFQPALSNAFTILTAQSVSGTFASANLPALGGSLAWQLTYAPTSVALSVVKAPLSALKFTASPVISGTSLTISATNTGVGSVYLLTSTNAAAPLNTWTPIWTNVLNGNSSFTTNLLNAVNPALHQQFYLLGNTNN